MIKDKFDNLIFQETELLELIYQNHLTFDNLIVESTPEIEQFEQSSSIQLKKINPDLYELTIEDFDKECQRDWFIPEVYKDLDIEAILINACPKENYNRLVQELDEYKARNLLPLLRTLKYLIDTLRSNQIVWGVGRGSSVSSYALYLLGIHKIDSVKYNLDWQEFLR